MTRNRKLKKRVRELKREQNLRYTQARRTVVLSGGEASRWYGPLPQFYAAIDMTTRMVVRQYAFPGLRDFQGRKLAHETFRGEDLRYANFARADLRHADFGCADLTGADFSRANLEGACFQGARFYSAGCCDIRRPEDYARCEPAISLFCGSRLVGATFDSADLSYTDFTGSELQGASFLNAQLPMAKLIDCNLREADLSGTWLGGADLTRAVLGSARLVRSAGEANFSGAKLAGASLFDANLSHSSFNQADLRGVDLRWASIEGADIEGARLETLQYSLATKFADYDPDSPPPLRTNDPGEADLQLLIETLRRVLFPSRRALQPQVVE